MANNQDMYEYIFNTRLTLQGIYELETDIIRELKIFLLDNGISEENLNELLYNFYKYFDMDISLEIIQNTSIVSINNVISIFESLITNSINNHQVNDADNDPDNDADNDADNDTDNDAYNHAVNDAVNDADNHNHNHVYNHADPIFITINPSVWGPSLWDINQNIIDMPLPIHNNHNNIINIFNNIFQHLPPNNNMQDVVVTVDDKDLEKIKSIKLESKHDTNCSICLGCLDKDEYASELECKHIFHTECIEPYLKQYNHICPVCRTEIGTAKYNI